MSLQKRKRSSSCWGKKVYGTHGEKSSSWWSAEKNITRRASGICWDKRRKEVINKEGFKHKENHFTIRKLQEVKYSFTVCFKVLPHTETLKARGSRHNMFSWEKSEPVISKRKFSNYYGLTIPPIYPFEQSLVTDWDLSISGVHHFAQRIKPGNSYPSLSGFNPCIIYHFSNPITNI